jgi:hypothetical protein
MARTPIDQTSELVRTLDPRGCCVGLRVVLGAQRAVDAPISVNICVRGGFHGTAVPWNNPLIRSDGPQPCSALSASFANMGPDVHYRQAW